MSDDVYSQMDRADKWRFASDELANRIPFNGVNERFYDASPIPLVNDWPCLLRSKGPLNQRRFYLRDRSTSTRVPKDCQISIVMGQ